MANVLKVFQGFEPPRTIVKNKKKELEPKKVTYEGRTRIDGKFYQHGVVYQFDEKEAGDLVKRCGEGIRAATTEEKKAFEAKKK
jgi:hypothetical protein